MINELAVIFYQNFCAFMIVDKTNTVESLDVRVVKGFCINITFNVNFMCGFFCTLVKKCIHYL